MYDTGGEIPFEEKRSLWIIFFVPGKIKICRTNSLYEKKKKVALIFSFFKATVHEYLMCNV